MKKYEGLCDKIRNLITSITDKLDNYNENYMKLIFSSDDDPIPK